MNVYSVALLHSRDFASSNQVVHLERGTIHEGLVFFGKGPNWRHNGCKDDPLVEESSQETFHIQIWSLTDAESPQEPFGVIHLADEESSPVTSRTSEKNFEAELAKITWLSTFDDICGTAAIVIHIHLLLWAFHGLRHLNTLDTIWIPIFI